MILLSQTERSVSAELAGRAPERAPYSPVLTAGCVLQLQDAFSRGLLKPGLNVVLEGPKKAVNDVVSGAPGRGYSAVGCASGSVVLRRPEFFSRERRSLCVAKTVTCPSIGG